MPPINYQPLAAIDQMAFDGNFINPKSAGRLMSAHSVLSGVWILAIIASLVLTIKIGQAGLYAVFIVGGAPFFLYWRYFNKQEEIVWRQFAAANNLEVIVPSEAKSMLPAGVAQCGHSHKNSSGVCGSIGGQTFTIVKDSYTVGYGKYSQDYTVTVILFSIDARLPRMFIESHSAMIGDVAKNFGNKLELEGDFNKQFKVYAQPDDEVDELTVLTPDLMQFLMANGKDYDFETAPGQLYIIAPEDMRRYAKLPGLMEFSASLYKQVLQNEPLAKT